MIRLVTTSVLCLLLVACAPAGQRSAKDSEQAASAQKLESEGNFIGAVGIYNKLIADSPTVLENYLELAILYRKAEQPQQAVAVMQKAQAQAPKNARVLTHLGYAYMDSEQPQQAEEAFKQAIAIVPGNPSAHNGRAIALDNMGEHAAAQESYRAALTLLPPNAADIQNNLAMSLILTRDYDGAIELLEPLVESDDANETMRQNLALAYGVKGDTKKAIAMNLKDLTQAQAKQNMKFYEQFRKQLKKKPGAAKAPKTSKAAKALRPEQEPAPAPTMPVARETPPVTAAPVALGATTMQTGEVDSGHAPASKRR